MAWIEPITNRTDGTALMTYRDMNRITGDVAFLQTEILGSSTISQTSWSRDDIITIEFWHEMLDDIVELGNVTSRTLEDMTDTMSWDNINTVEQNLLALYGGTANVTDMQAYGTTIVDAENDTANIDDSILITEDTASAWRDVFGG